MTIWKWLWKANNFWIYLPLGSLPFVDMQRTVESDFHFSPGCVMSKQVWMFGQVEHQVSLVANVAHSINFLNILRSMEIWISKWSVIEDGLSWICVLTLQCNLVIQSLFDNIKETRIINTLSYPNVQENIIIAMLQPKNFTWLINPEDYEENAPLIFHSSRSHLCDYYVSSRSIYFSSEINMHTLQSQHR